MSTEIVAFKEFELGLVTLEESNAGMEFDMTTPEGIDKCRKWYRTLRKGTNALDKIRKETGADYLRLKREVDAEAKTIQVRLDVMEMPHKIALDDIEVAEQAEIDRIAAEAIAKAEYDEDERLAWLEYRERVITEKEDAQKAVEDEACEAAEQVKRNEEAAVVTRKAVADAVLDTERKAHEAKGKLAAKQLKEKTDAQAVIDEADKVEAERVADVAHQTNIHLEITESLSGYTRNAANADMLMAAIVDGRVPHIKIVY